MKTISYPHWDSKQKQYFIPRGIPKISDPLQGLQDDSTFTFIPSLVIFLIFVADKYMPQSGVASLQVSPKGYPLLVVPLTLDVWPWISEFSFSF